MRYVTFRFDDGFIGGARKAAAVLAPDHASFFLVADLVTGAFDCPDIPGFAGCDFGSVAEWREFSAGGHDVQLHSCTHANMALLPPEDQLRELRGSLALGRRIHDGPFVFWHRFNALTQIDFAAEGIAAAGFATRGSEAPVQFNAIDGSADVFCLNSWAVRERHFGDVAGQLADVPGASWVILAFHSMDGEGHEPWSLEGFTRLVAEVRAMGYKIATVAEMIRDVLPAAGAAARVLDAATL